MQPILPLDSQVAAIIPQYGPAGDGTRILTTTGAACDVPQRPRATVARLARTRCTDLVALRRRMQTALGRRVLPPLPLAPGLVLVALKLRQPRVTGDPAHGWVNSVVVQRVAPLDRHPFRTEIMLTGGWRIACCWSVGTVKDHLRLAALVSTAGLATLPAAAEAAGHYGPDLAELEEQLQAALAALQKIKTDPPPL